MQYSKMLNRDLLPYCPLNINFMAKALNCVLSVSSDSINISLRIAFDINYIPTMTEPTSGNCSVSLTTIPF